MNILQDILNVLRRGETWVYSPLEGGNQYGLSVSSSVVTLTVPPNACYGEAYVRTASITLTRGVVSPTASQGVQANEGDIIVLDSRAKLLALKLIRVATDATIDVEYFEKVAI